jgi:small GTP-binding protein
MRLFTSVANQYKNYQIKVVLLGPAESGKTALMKRIISDEFTMEDYVPTIGFSFGCKKINENNENEDFEFKIWDTDSQERSLSFLSSYYRNTGVLLFTVDLSKNGAIAETMEIFNSLIDSLRSSSDKTIIVIVGTKSDLEREVTDKNIDDFAIYISRSLNSKPILYIETSANTGKGIISSSSNYRQISV